MALPYLIIFLTLPNKISQIFTYKSHNTDNYQEITFCLTKHAFQRLDFLCQKQKPDLNTDRGLSKPRQLKNRTVMSAYIKKLVFSTVMCMECEKMNT
jgi:hypothetical protein